MVEVRVLSKSIGRFFVTLGRHATRSAIGIGVDKRPECVDVDTGSNARRRWFRRRRE
jgi:hypothetical protein